jgi:hypothetical protein
VSDQQAHPDHDPEDSSSPEQPAVDLSSLPPDAIAQALQAADPEVVQELLAKAGIVHNPDLMRQMRKQTKKAAEIIKRDREQQEAQERAASFAEAGVPEHLIDAVDNLHPEDAEITAESAQEVMERFNLGQVLSPEQVHQERMEAQRQAAESARRMLQTEGVVESGIPPGLDAQIANVDQSLILANAAGDTAARKEALDASFALKQQKLIRAARSMGITR